ncbi:putative fructosyl amino acid protein [Immersiella caudata]|uniref:Fructosyl amino acid protein n=1 Tax=Immersiella caudata TaxID=314043 RepID=A0AA39WKM4_9PEZI|nr:putative fructosyl amino acid protein [Immersiella caudata]
MARSPSPPPLFPFASQQPTSSHETFSPPPSILIVGSGIFGLSTAWALARRDLFAKCTITVVDRSDPLNPDAFPAPDAASVDTSRIVRADYADKAYAALGAEAQLQWRKQAKPTDLGAQGRYHESGLLLVADPGPVRIPGEIVAKSDMTGMDYVRSSWANVLSLAADNPDLAGRIRELPDVDAIRERLGTGGSSGSWGYINEGSGWADATASTKWLFDKVKATGRVTFVSGTVASLEHSGATVTGAKLSDGRILSAELVVLATGAWTGGLVDLSGQATATGQVLGYLDLTEAEQQLLNDMPVILNLTNGLFIIPPRNRVLKIARHSYGYLNPAVPPTARLPSTSPASQPISYPLTHLSDPSLSIPQEGADDLRRALREMVPLPGLADRAFTKTRICWYSDTPTGDFLITYHPQYNGLFIATGDSGHGFKFMPVLGEKIADCITHSCPLEFVGKWSWKPDTELIITEDGSRGGKPGLTLANELGKES